MEKRGTPFNKRHGWWIALAVCVVGWLHGCRPVHPDGNPDASYILAALQSGSSSAALPQSIADTHLFKDSSPKRPALGLVPYDVKVHLWSDGAHKQRYIFLPPTGTVNQDAKTGDLIFPVGTTLVKHFTTATVPEFAIETRVMTLREGGKWVFGTYVWDDSGRAVLNARPRKVSRGGLDYRIPSEQECMSCHPPSNPPLGFALRQLNFVGDKGLNQIAYLHKLKMFSTPLDRLTAVKVLDDPADTKLPLEVRARTYLDVNCSACHYPGGPEKANQIDLRLDAADTKLVSAGKIVPGDISHSILWKKITAETERMPLISLRTDPLAAMLLKAYIEQFQTTH